MCRMLYLPPGPKLSFETARRIAAQLRRSQGGDGGGVYLPQEKGKIIKGLAMGFHTTYRFGLSVVREKEEASVDDEMAAVLSTAHNGEALAHWRMSTVGQTNNRLCHPFRVGRRGAIIHNGHWGGWHLIARLLGIRKSNNSDTYTLARLVERLGPSAIGQADPGAVIYHDGQFARLWKTTWKQFGQGTLDGRVYCASERLDHSDSWVEIGHANGVVLPLTEGDLLKHRKAVSHDLYERAWCGRSDPPQKDSGGSNGTRPVVSGSDNQNHKRERRADGDQLLLGRERDQSSGRGFHKGGKE